jgi:hypothetical protein
VFLSGRLRKVRHGFGFTPLGLSFPLFFCKFGSDGPKTAKSFLFDELGLEVTARG